MGEPLGLLHRRLDLVQPEVVGDLLGVIHHVVERGRERVHGFAVDRRHEHLVQAADYGVRDPVPILLADEDVARQPGVLRVAAEHLVEQVGRAQDVGGGLLEEIEELPVFRHE